VGRSAEFQHLTRARELAGGGHGQVVARPTVTQSGQDLKGTRTAVAVVNEEGSVGGGCKFELVERDHKWRASEGGRGPRRCGLLAVNRPGGRLVFGMLGVVGGRL